MGEKNPNYGHHWTPEMKQAARERLKNRNYWGPNNPNYGHHWTDEIKKSHLKEEKQTQDVKKKIMEELLNGLFWKLVIRLF